MKVEFLQDRPGHARLALSGLPTAPLAGAAYGVSLQRSTDKAFMGRSGNGTWTNQEEFLTLPCSVEGEALVLALGPEHVNHITGDTYRLRLREGAEVLGEGRLGIRNVLTDQLSGSGQLAEQAVEAKAPVAAAAPAPQPEPEPLTRVSEEIPMPAPQPQGGAGKWLLVLVLLLLLGLGGAALWYFVLGGKDKLAPAPAPSAQVEEVKAPEAPKAEEPAKAGEPAKMEEPAKEQPQPVVEQAAPVQAASPQVVVVRERVGAFFAGADRTPPKAWALSQELSGNTPEDQDALFRLFHFAANGDVQEAYLSYARCLDPTTPAWGSIKKDAQEAWDFYQKAGTPEASAAAQALLAHMRANAEKGDAAARQWLKATGN